MKENSNQLSPQPFASRFSLTGCRRRPCIPPSLTSPALLHRLSVPPVRHLPSRLQFGRQAALPPGWPLPPSTEVWVCTSTSGAAPMTREAREQPYVQLAERLAQLPWPLPRQPACAPLGAAVAAGVATGRAAGQVDGGAEAVGAGGGGASADRGAGDADSGVMAASGEGEARGGAAGVGPFASEAAEARAGAGVGVAGAGGEAAAGGAEDMAG